MGVVGLGRIVTAKGPGQLLDGSPARRWLGAFVEEVEDRLVGGRQTRCPQNRFIAVGGNCQDQAQKNRDCGHGSTPSCSTGTRASRKPITQSPWQNGYREFSVTCEERKAENIKT